MAYRAQDTWSSDYDYLIDLSYQIESRLEGGGAQVRSDDVASMMSEYKQGLNSLKRQLKHHSLSERERAQRQKQLDQLTDKLDQFNRIGDSSSRSFGDHDDTFQSHPYSSGLGGVGPGIGQRMTPDELQQQQRQMIAEQDRGLDAISAALRRQQKVGLAIQDEVSEHNVLIDDISAGTSRADARIRRETQRIEERRRKEKTWCSCILWTIAILLAIAIIVVAVVPK
ncbi:PREDICTED: syntaxin-8-like [Amphimedon queenslandica]|uniref:t-SNARE coiled-coil homology domain-containing protein n=1 Tax=Amphimedon queenslandica TaxID=400682 RepID=A0A1X7VUA3_AMPQE|nr:PREDICTED: syntaxin-8-like [Amphimedon queenslandica]|eukprot:XP_003382897.1 PREDICTED: syntaxin-8-like [Amphimedon queenslandica]